MCDDAVRRLGLDFSSHGCRRASRMSSTHRWRRDVRRRRAAIDPLALQQEGAAHLRKLFVKGDTGLDGRPISSMWTVTVVEARQGGTPTNEHVYELCFVCRLCGAPVRKRCLGAHRKAPRSCVRSPRDT